MIGIRHVATQAYLLCLPWFLLSSFAVDAQQESVWLLLDESPPIVVGDRVYATSFNHVYAIDADRNVVLWEATLDEHHHSGLTQFGNRLVTVTRKTNRLLWIEPDDGRVSRGRNLRSLWEVEYYTWFNALVPANSLLLVVGPGILALRPDYSVAWQTGFYMADPEGIVAIGHRMFVIGAAAGDYPLQLLALDLSDGHIVGSAVCGGAGERALGPVLSGDLAVVCAEGRLKAYDQDSFELIWTSEPGPGGFSRPCIAEEDQIAIAGSQGAWGIGYVHGIAAAFDLRTGRQIWSAELDRGVNGCVIAGDAVVTTSLHKWSLSSTTEGEVACFSIRRGERRWHHRIDLEPVAAPIILGETVWIKCVDPGSIRAAQPGEPGYVEAQSNELDCGEPPTPRDYYLVPIDVLSGVVGQPIKLSAPSQPAHMSTQTNTSPRPIHPGLIVGIVSVAILGLVIVLWVRGRVMSSRVANDS